MSRSSQGAGYSCKGHIISRPKSRPPLGRYTPPVQTHPRAGGMHPTGMHSCYHPQTNLRRLCFYTCLSVILFTGVPGQVHPPGRSTPRQVHPKAGTPPPRQVHPLDRYTPRSSACWEIRATSGRYSSYWNAFLCLNYFHSH